MNKQNITNYRKTEYNINPIFINRWSPRAMSGEKIKESELMPLFEAAKWAPSSYNSQPWRFIYTTKDSQNWNKFFSLLNEFNQLWVKNASALILLISRKNFEHNNAFSQSHSFDSGAAWMSLALQSQLSGLVTHAIVGFNYEKARIELGIPGDYNIEIMIAVGKQSNPDILPSHLKEREFPSDRKKLREITSKDRFIF